MRRLVESPVPKKIALFGGSFDPPHHGHVHLLLYAQEELGFSEIIIIPNAQNPLKQHCASAQHRYRMVQKMFSPLPGVSILDYEMNAEAEEAHHPRYTIDTVRYILSSLYPGLGRDRLFFLMGSDCIGRISEWKEYEALFSLVTPLIFVREDKERVISRIKDQKLSPELQQSLIQGIAMPPRWDISSTMVRQRIQKKQWVSHLISHDVHTYITAHRLYQTIDNTP